MTDTKWNTTTPAAAGFAPDLDETFKIARQAGTLPNLHGVIAAHAGWIFFERYLAGPFVIDPEGYPLEAVCRKDLHSAQNS